MHTGHVNQMLERSQTLRQFILSCAGYTLHTDLPADMQEEEGLPGRQPIPARPPHDYSNYEEAGKEEVRLRELEAMKEEEAAQLAFGETEKSRIVHERETHVADIVARAAAIDAMLVKVLAWEPPTPEHEEVKAIAQEQLLASRPDVTSYEERLAEALAQQPDAYYRSAVEYAKGALQFHRERQNQDNKQVRWWRALAASLPPQE